LEVIEGKKNETRIQKNNSNKPKTKGSKHATTKDEQIIYE